ncbi:MAG TPA: response regulator transcription factor [Anaerolineales bacterium]|nr:response regulator transcription factor [Anaerolineales bacterium]
MITVILADDHPVVRDGLCFLLNSQTDIKVIGTADNGHEAVQLADKLKPDVAVMDIAMPLLNGIEATQQITATHPHTRVMILSIHFTSVHIQRALQAGAMGYLLKESAGEEVVEAIRTVYEGRRYLSRKIAETVVEDYVRQGSGDVLEGLSPRERQVLQLIAEGKTSSEAAAILFLSVKTVETYRSRFMQKLGLKDMTALVKFAIQHGIISLDQ